MSRVMSHTWIYRPPEWVISLIWMSHGAESTKAGHIYSNTRRSDVTHINQPRAGMGHVTHMHESKRRIDWSKTHVLAHSKESCHAHTHLESIPHWNGSWHSYDWVTNMNTSRHRIDRSRTGSCLSHGWVTHMNESRHRFDRSRAHVSAHSKESCHTHNSITNVNESCRSYVWVTSQNRQKQGTCIRKATPIRWKFWKVSSLLNLLHIMGTRLTFKTFD